ncbi:MAG TPA: NAD(P)-dependent oxidoreductase [Stellaceae bacterium]|nr:NAD(P)-dependent oxidoreductase [Stellaceae bacterium]
MAKPKIGVIGTGRMGLAMVKHLLRHGYPAVVTDIDTEQVKKATALGAEAAKTPAEIGAVSDFAIIAVGYDEEVLAVTTGANGLFDTMARGAIIGISSTCAPDTAERLAELGRSKGIEIYDAPICRGRRAADDGTLLATVGGSDEVVERARPVYETFCSDIVHIGPVGHGQIAKAINNFALWVNGLALIEAGRLAETFGVDLPRLRKALLMSTGKSGALEGWQTMSFAWALKDMQIVSRMTDRANLGMPLIGAVRELVKEGRKIKQTNPPDWTGAGSDLA